jgi:hypothetical protein
MKKEQDAAYNTIVAAMQEVNSRRTFRNIGTPERRDLDRAVLLLEELSWKIMSADIAKFAERTGAAAKDLKALAGKIEKSHTKLRAVSSAVRKAADAAGIVADIAGTII